MNKEILGLTEEEVKSRKEQGLTNRKTEKASRSVGEILRGNILTLFNMINFVMAVLILSVRSYRDLLFMGVIISNIVIGIVQELRAKRTVEKLSLIAASKVKVYRNGKKIKIELWDIVMDDIMELGSGNQICADAIVVDGECEVDESLLTGESDPVLKRNGDTILSGSFVIMGNVKAKVIHVGKDNYANNLVSQAKKIKQVKSELMTSVKSIIKTVSFFIIPIGIMMFYNQIVVVGQPYERAVTSAAGAMIAMIPEGLVLLTSLVFAVSIIRLGKEKTLVQELYCIEALARVDVLCLDKTGTITEGKMEVEEIIPLCYGSYEEAMEAFVASMEDNNPTFEAMKARFTNGTNWKMTYKIPFSSANKWSLVSFEEKGSYILGATEFILGKRSEVYQEKLSFYAKKGYRVLLFAHSPYEADTQALPNQIEPMAFILISDVIRSDAKQTLQYFKEQGVEIKVISGDNPITVSNVAKKAGLDHANEYVDATTLVEKEDIDNAVKNYTVFGRVTPSQKLELVKALKEQGHTVAMTGDGVNDVLAFKEADCSIAMESGSDVARKTAQLVLLDSNFSAMPKIVAEGRRSINNIQRSASLFLVKTVYSFLLALIFMLIHTEYPFQPIQSTFMSSIAVGIPSFLLALEPNFNRVKGNFLRNVFATALPGGFLVVINILIVTIISNLMQYTIPEATTICVYVTTMASMMVLFHVCMPMNKMRSVMFIVLILMFFMGVTAAREAFYLIPLSISKIAVVAAVGVISPVIFYGLQVIFEKIIGVKIRK